MKKNVTVLLAMLLALTALLPGCKKYAGEVNVYNWGEYIDESVYEDFEKETGVKVNYQTFENNEAMYAALKTGGTSYDVIIPSDYMIARLINEGMLEKLDFANIPNYSLLGGAYKNAAYDPAGEYSVTYMWGTVGIIYNSELITDEITSWESLFNPKYDKQILMFDNPRDAMGIALKRLGYSLNTTDESELRAAFDLLAEQKPILQAYVMDQIYDKLESGEAALGPYYAGDYISMKENNPALRFVLPEEGSNVFSDAMCVPKGAANKKNAELFINYMTATDSALKNMDAIGYISANAAAAEEYGAELDPGDYAVQFPSDEVLARCEPFYNLPPDTLKLYDEFWGELRK